MILLFIFLLFILIFYTYRKKWAPSRPDFYPFGEMIKIGHRGAPTLAQENTLASFEQAFKNGLKGIELDVQLSKDGKLLVFHDWTMKNLADYSEYIENMSYAKILDLSYANNCKIPLLSEVLGICPKDNFINIEIKSQYYSNTQIVKKVMQTIQNYRLEKNIIISSFNPFVLQLVKNIVPDFPTALIWSSEAPLFLFHSPLWIWMCRPDALHIDIDNADEKIIRWARKNNLVILAFTINNTADFLKAQALGLDGIFTDDPHLNIGSTSLHRNQLQFSEQPKI